MSTLSLADITGMYYQQSRHMKHSPFVPLWVVKDPEAALCTIRDELAIGVKSYLENPAAYKKPIDAILSRTNLPRMYDNKMGLYIGLGEVRWIYLDSLLASMLVSGKKTRPINIERAITLSYGEIERCNVKVKFKNGLRLEYRSIPEPGKSSPDSLGWVRDGVIEQRFNVKWEFSFKGLMAAAEQFSETGVLDEAYRLHLARPLGLDLSVLSQKEKVVLFSYDLML